VDFATFPKKVIELLEAATGGSQNERNTADRHPLPTTTITTTTRTKDLVISRNQIMCLISSSECHLLCNPLCCVSVRFFAHLYVSDSGGIESLFNLTETNPFKQLTHLSLRCRAGNDAAVKKYLAGRLTSLKSAAFDLGSDLSSSNAELESLRRECEGYDRERSLAAQEAGQKLRELQASHATAMAEAREFAMVELSAVRGQAEADLRAAAASHASEAELLGEARERNNALIEV